RAEKDLVKQSVSLYNIYLISKMRCRCMAKVKIHVTLKEGVLDPQGKTVRMALDKMGYKDITDVRIGKYIEIETKGAKTKKTEKEINEICDKLLANPNIEKYTFKIS
ncbi:MAG: phosphoribosylformylglycinamidine synthase subunit PurS, partial [Candidatus Goldiibacteriota bacterium]